MQVWACWQAVAQRVGAAMRYYCLWIYACNLVLLLAVAVFVCYAGTVLADHRLAFVPHVRFYQPTLVYAYAAVLVQAGVVQAVGCYAARHLNERLLNVYWFMLLGLLLGDLGVGVVWIIRYDRICRDMLPMLQHQLQQSYGTDAEFTRRWDRLQVESECCGVAGPLDYNATLAFATSVFGTAAAVAPGSEHQGMLTFHVPATCCHPSQALPLQLSAPTTTPRSFASGHLDDPDDAPLGDNKSYRREYDAQYEDDEEEEEEEGGGDGFQTRKKRRTRATHRHRHWQRTGAHMVRHLSMRQSDGSSASRRLNQKVSPTLNFTCLDADLAPKLEPRLDGCGPELAKWVSKSADALFVLGFCVIAFVKICFLGLLRYEIKEMIQKIKVLKSEGEEGARQSEFAEIAAAFGAAAATQAQTTAASANHVPFVPTP
ncbi:unnamed protein product, partial [Notodromas monacha]